MDTLTHPSAQTGGMAGETGRSRRARNSYDCRLVARLPRVSEASGPSLRTADEVAAQCKDMAELAQESFNVLTLNQKHQVLRRHLISLGTLTGTIVHPREVFRPALVDSAAAVVLVHNHPSGQPAPSRDDIELTARLVEAGRLIGIRVLDHVVVSRGGHYSFVMNGQMAADGL
jgi:DNA repair protein RadC